MTTTLATENLMQSFAIEGGKPLSGTVRAAGNKNGALPILAATVLATEPVRITNLPRIRDVETMLALLTDIGADVAWEGENEVRIDPANVTKTDLDEELCRRIRASFLLAGPLLARFGRVVVPPPGGDVIGRRRLDPHVHALNALGAEISINGTYEMRTSGLRGTSVFLDEASVMATENVIMAAVTAEGETIVGNAACEPHVQDLCRFLVSLGAQIDGIESNVLRIEGVPQLGGGDWRVAPEHIEVGSFIGLAACTGGDLTIEDINPNDLVSILPAFERLGVQVEVGTSSLRVPPKQELVIQDDLGGQISKIEDGPWPAFPADLTSIAVVTATQARGTILIFEKMFESRLFFVDKLVGMGARIILCDPHRAVDHRPSPALRRAPDEPGHPGRDGHADRGALRGGHLDDRQHRRDRPRLRADRRAAQVARRVDRARRQLDAQVDRGARGAGDVVAAGERDAEPVLPARERESPPGVSGRIRHRVVGGEPALPVVALEQERSPARRRAGDRERRSEP